MVICKTTRLFDQFRRETICVGLVVDELCIDVVKDLSEEGFFQSCFTMYVSLKSTHIPLEHLGCIHVLTAL